MPLGSELRSLIHGKPGRLTLIAANRAQGKITSLDANGIGVLKMDDGRELQWDANVMRHVQYGYGRTSYAVQCETTKKAYVHIDCGDSKIRNLLSAEYLYVSGTRPEEELVLFTDDKKALLSEHSPVAKRTVKATALNPAEYKASRGQGRAA